MCTQTLCTLADTCCTPATNRHLLYTLALFLTLERVHVRKRETNL